MAESVRFDIFLKDFMSNPLTNIGKTGDNVFAKLTQGAKQVDQATRNTSNNSGGIGRMQSGLQSVLGLAAKVTGGLAAFSAIKGISKAGMDMEQTRISFETMLGSADKATKTLAELNEFANVTPFTNNEVIKAGRNLLAFGVSTDKLNGSLKAIGDVSAGLNVPFGELSEIYGKIKVQQTVFSEDLNQLAGRGIPIFDELAKVMGINASEVKKFASEGKIGFDQIELAFQNMTGEGGKFFNLMEKQSQTAGGRISTLMGKLQLMGVGIGEALLPGIGGVVDFGISVIENIAPAQDAFNGILLTLQPLWEAFQNLLGAVFPVEKGMNAGAMATQGFARVLDMLRLPLDFIVVNLSALVGFITDNIAWIKPLVTAYGLWTAAQWVLNAALSANPISLMIGAITALVGSIVYAYQRFEWFRGGIQGIFSSLTAMFENYVEGFKNAFGGIGQILSSIVAGDVAGVLAGFKQLGQGLLSTSTFGAIGSNNVGEAFKTGYTKGAAEISGEGVQGSAFSSTESLANALAGVATPGKKAGGGGASPSALAGNSTGTASSVTGGRGSGKALSVRIEKLVETLNINMGSASDVSNGKLRDMIQRELTAGIRDFELSYS